MASRGRPRRRPEIFQGDRAYGSATNIAATVKRRIVSLLARQAQEHGSGLGRFRYVVERTLSWFGQNRRLKICYEKFGEHFQAFHDLAAALICARKLATAKRRL
jgi:transposase